jgi:hypothetical protein
MEKASQYSPADPLCQMGLGATTRPPADLAPRGWIIGITPPSCRIGDNIVTDGLLRTFIARNMLAVIALPNRRTRSMAHPIDTPRPCRAPSHS